MSFGVRDLMIDVFPTFPVMACVPDTTPQPAPPCQPPSCQKNSAKAAEDDEPGVRLVPLEVLREQLHQVLHP